MTNIRFNNREILDGIIPEPKPALKFAPNFYKNLPTTFDSGNPYDRGTAKRCIPVLDALSSGFIIPLWTDIVVIAKEGLIDLHTYSEEFPIGSHPAAQFTNHPRWDMPYGQLVWKFVNPWVVVTDKNYSCIFTSPMNHLEQRFKVLDGVVDTDSYPDRIHFPFIWTGGDGEFLLEKGTPLIQVIPFKREQYKMHIGIADEDKARKTRISLMTLAKHRYRKLFWHKRKDLA